MVPERRQNNGAGGLGIPDIIIILFVLLVSVGLPVVLIVALSSFLNDAVSQCTHEEMRLCAYSIPLEAQFVVTAPEN